MSKRKSTLLAWTICAIVIVLNLVDIIRQITATSLPINLSDLASSVTYSLFLVISAVVGAMIISRHPRNIIGWLLMFFPITSALTVPLEFLAPLPTGPAIASPLLFWRVWLGSWSWWLLIGPILLIPLLFPTGKLISRRWRWVIVSMSVSFAFFLVIVTFSATYEVQNTQLKNPIGLFTEDITGLLLVPFQIMLFATAASSVASIFVRYRRASAEVREQIKWLLYACGVFLVVYFIGFIVQFENNSWDIIFDIVLSGIPLAIGAAILRYHLWDIDLIINRTLVYVPLTAILGGLYSAMITLSQKFLIATTGQKSDAALVMTTFLLVATFTPIKNVLQQVVDKRFKESKNTLKEIKTLDDQVRSVMEVLDAGQIPRRLLTTAINAFQASGGAVYLDHQIESMGPLYATPGWRDEDQRLSLPLEWGGRRFGMLYLGPRKTGIEYSPEERKVLLQAANRVAWAIAGSSVPVSE